MSSLGCQTKPPSFFTYHATLLSQNLSPPALKPVESKVMVHINSVRHTSVHKSSRRRVQHQLEEPTESSILLSSNEQSGTAGVFKPDDIKIRDRPRRTLVLLFAIVFLQVCGEQLIEAPRTRIVESIFCYRFYEKYDPSKILHGRDTVAAGAVNGVDESWCKVDAIQSDMANLASYQQIFDSLMSLLLALPFGMAADKFGRKPFLISGFVSSLARWVWYEYVCWFWQQQSIYWTLLSSLNGLFAGSTTVLYNLIFVVVSDVTPQEEQTNAFFRLGAASLFPLLLIPPLSAWSMRVSPWLPSSAGLLFLLVALFLAMFVPETLKNQEHDPHEAQDIINTSPACNECLMETGTEYPQTQPCTPNREQITDDSSVYEDSWLQQTKNFVFKYWTLMIILLPYTEHLLISGTSQLQVQFLSRRLGFTISQATLFFSLRAGCSILLFLVVLPRLSTYMTREQRWSTQVKDLYLARVSIFLQAAGWTGTGMATNTLFVAVSMTVSTLGSGTALFLRSLAASLVPSSRLATLFSVISVIDIVGSMLGAPILAAAFGWGMRHGTFWVGMPFDLIGLWSVICGGLLFTVKTH
ncbi:MFS general substrate transporter [Pseudovirgaria hyperparasitica]|uniref:MFS general substrate transporter n=1 Tax=Pseudovirgaria hyperparasitica TaxID=470096 RepID=A0A6A6WGL5_9PEZI|nr:MFS general substrate transporter [Pseudovirgaria hyperparasitica]KAF2761933.1 MFS general substrate transporter [Pseudovirgaria hyperparasitica]